MDNETEKWIERFYSDLERDKALKYKRPADYVERALRVLNGTRKPMKCIQDISKGVTYDEHK